jgi:hydroxyacylglutathione hydrolase
MRARRSRCWGRFLLQLAEGVHLVGSGRLGFSTSHPLDCHTYLVSSESDAVLIDAGCGLGHDAILAAIDASGVSRRRISKILLTHAHADHAGGAASLARELGAEIVTSAEVAAMLRGPDEDAIGLESARRAGTYPPDFTVSPTLVDLSIGAGHFVAGGLAIEAIETPGHARGHFAYLLEIGRHRLLFSGDLVFARGRVVVLGTMDSDVPLLAASIKRVAALRPDVLLPGHGEIVLSGASEHVEAAVTCFRRGQLPPSLL